MNYSPSNTTEEQQIHYASLEKVYGDLHLILDVLTDPDEILLKTGKDVGDLRKLQNDDQVEACWNVRKAALIKTGWHVTPGGESAKEKQVCEEFQNLLQNEFGMATIHSEMLDAAALGFSPLEIMWINKGNWWNPSNLIGKPTEWFGFGVNKELKFKSSLYSALGSETVPPNRFLVVSNGASYANPYGVKQFSKCYWPVQFKQNGWKWWALFLEKFGGSLLWGEYDENASEKDKTALLDGLYKVISGGAGIGPKGASVKVLTDMQKGAAGSIHQKFEEFSNAAISKVLLGQTLTTEVLNGSMAAANIHNLVREDIRLSDMKMCSSAWNRLSKMYTLFNYGNEVKAPKFCYEGEEDLQTARADRDKTLKDLGVKFKKNYFSEIYGISEEYFDIAETAKNGSPEFSVDPAGVIHFSQNKQNDSIMEEYMEEQANKGQDIMNKMVKLFHNEVEKAKDWDDARERIIKKLESDSMFKQRKELSEILDNIRFTGINTGSSDA